MIVDMNYLHTTMIIFCFFIKYTAHYTQLLLFRKSNIYNIPWYCCVANGVTTSLEASILEPFNVLDKKHVRM